MKISTPWETLEVLKVPSTTTEWFSLSEKFEISWKFTTGLFAVEGKGVIIQQPANPGKPFLREEFLRIVAGSEVEIPKQRKREANTQKLLYTVPHNRGI